MCLFVYTGKKNAVSVVLIRVSNMYVISRVCPSGLLAGQLFCVAKTLVLDITRKLCNQMFFTCHTYRHHSLVPFYTTFIDLGGGSLG